MKFFSKKIIYPKRQFTDNLSPRLFSDTPIAISEVRKQAEFEENCAIVSMHGQNESLRYSQINRESQPLLCISYLLIRSARTLSGIVREDGLFRHIISGTLPQTPLRNTPARRYIPLPTVNYSGSSILTPSRNYAGQQ